MPMITKIQSNESYISTSGGNDTDLPHPSFTKIAGLPATAAAEVTGADGNAEIATTTFVEDDSPASIAKDAIPHDCTNDDDGSSSSVTTRLYTGRTLLKHKLTLNDDEDDVSIVKPAKVRLKEHATITTTEANETLAACGGDYDVSEEQKDDAVVCNSNSFTTNGASDGQSPQTEDSPTERCKNIRL